MRETKTWAPVFEDTQGNQLVLTNGAYWAASEEEAERIKTGCMLVECILLRLKVVGVREFRSDVETPNVEAYLPNRGGHMPVLVAVISGPLLDEARNGTALTPEVSDAGR